MNLSRIFIERPIMTALVTFALAPMDVYNLLRYLRQRYPALHIHA